jgi:hypothetical protein
MEEQPSEEWVPMSEAAKRLGVSAPKLSRLVSKGKVGTREDPYDERVKLVNFIELRRIFPERRR